MVFKDMTDDAFDNLVPVKLHCSMFVEDAIKTTFNDYKTKQLSLIKSGQHLHIIVYNWSIKA